MEKRYLLLRRNIETGPFTLTQLLQMSLLPQDLIKVEGEAAGWSHPSALDDLKVSRSSHDSNSDRSQSLNDTLPKNDDGGSVNNTPVHKGQLAKPPVNSENGWSALGSLPTTISSLPDVAPYRPVTEIKNEYADLTLKRKSRSARSAPAFLYVALFLLFAGITYTLFLWKPLARVDSVSAIKEAAKPLSNAQEAPVRELTAAEPINAQAEVATPVPNLPTDVADRGDQVSITKEGMHQQKINAGNAEPVIDDTKDEERIVEQKDNPGAEVINKDETGSDKQVLFKSVSSKTNERDPVPLKQLLDVHSIYFRSDDGIGLSITLENKSTQTIRVAAINVYFLNKDKEEVKKQTLYFSDVPAGKSNTRKTIAFKAASATYQVGLISSEQKGLYVQQ